MREIATGAENEGNGHRNWGSSFGDGNGELGRRKAVEAWSEMEDGQISPPVPKMRRSTLKWGIWVGENGRMLVSGVDGQRMQVRAEKGGRTARTGEMGCQTWWREIFGLTQWGKILTLGGNEEMFDF